MIILLFSVNNSFERLFCLTGQNFFENKTSKKVNIMKEKDNEIKKELDSEIDEHKSFLSGKGFYFICAVCLIAIGISAWTAFSAIKPMPTDDESSSPSRYQTSSKPSESTVSTQSPESEIPKPTPSVPQETNEAGTEAPPVASFFVMPMPSHTFYKKFNDSSLQYSCTYDDYRVHKADDITSKTSSNVNACGDGIVTEIYYSELLGTVIEIDHGNGVTIKYCGLKQNTNVKKGDKVTPTTVIGSLDTVPSECLDPKHLHLEVTKNGKPIGLSDLIK